MLYQYADEIVNLTFGFFSGFLAKIYQGLGERVDECVHGGVGEGEKRKGGWGKGRMVHPVLIY